MSFNGSSDYFDEGDLFDESAANLTEETDELGDIEEDHEVSIRYTVFVPIFFGACLVTFCMNAVIIAAFPLVRNLSRVTRPYITFILSLVISDAFASFLLGFQLLTGSYLPVVHGTLINICFLLAAEALKLTGIIVTVFHLLVMVSIHLAGVVDPVRFKEHMTLRVSRAMVILLWLLPLIGIMLPFSVIPGQGFQSPGCATYDFLTKMPFRAAFSGLIVFPTAAIIVLYLYFHSLLWRRRDVSKSSVSRQNIRAARITFLIMLTCTCGWIPAVVNHMLICSSGCKYQPSDFSANTLFIMHAVGYVLVILKSFTNPLIFAFRQSNIQRALISLGRMLLCRKQESAFDRTASSRYSSFTRSSTNRDRQRGGLGGGHGGSSIRRPLQGPNATAAGGGNNAGSGAVRKLNNASNRVN